VVPAVAAVVPVFGGTPVVGFVVVAVGLDVTGGLTTEVGIPAGLVVVAADFVVVTAGFVVVVVVFGLLTNLLINAPAPAPAAVFNNVLVKELLGFVVVGFTTGVVGFTTGVVGFTVLVIGLTGGFTVGLTGVTGLVTGLVIVVGLVTGLVAVVCFTAGLVTAAGFVAGFVVAAGFTVEVTGVFAGALLPTPVEVIEEAGFVPVEVVPATGRIALVPPATA
jgi:hypothetical protein